MPHPTFHHLPEEKQNRIFEAAVDEFSQHPFSAASINRIVKSAQIPRGSFYQYFTSKEDLYLYVLERIGAEKLKIFSNYQRPSSDLGFFDAMLAALPAIFDWADKCPRYNQIAMLMLQDGSEFIRSVTTKLNASQQSLLSLFAREQRMGLIRSDVDLDLAMELYLAMAPTLLREYYASGTRESTIRKAMALFDIIGNGIFVRQQGGNP